MLTTKISFFFYNTICYQLPTFSFADFARERKRERDNDIQNYCLSTSENWLEIEV